MVSPLLTHWRYNSLAPSHTLWKQFHSNEACHLSAIAGATVLVPCHVKYLQIYMKSMGTQSGFEWLELMLQCYKDNTRILVPVMVTCFIPTLIKQDAACMSDPKSHQSCVSHVTLSRHPTGSGSVASSSNSSSISSWRRKCIQHCAEKLIGFFTLQITESAEPWFNVKASVLEFYCGDEIDWLMQEGRNSSVLAMELHLSCTNPSKWS